jgi:hypothetical protein
LGLRSFRFEDDFYEVDNEKYYDLQLPLAKGCAPVTKNRAVERRRAIESLFQTVTTASSLIITLGLVEAWWDKESALYTNATINREIGRKSPDRFELHILSYEQVRGAVFAICDLIIQAAPSVEQIILTVSPVPLSATFSTQDILVSNTYSKSALRTAAEEASAQFELVKYFPSYESVTLSDRDAAWEDDLIHVTDSLVKFNVGRLPIES